MTVRFHGPIVFGLTAGASATRTGGVSIHALDHVQLAIPAGGEDRARAFYIDVLGFREIDKPTALAGRGGLWLSGGHARVHLGVDPDFRPARKAHPALIVEDLDALSATLEDARVAIDPGTPIDAWRRVYVADPFGNRIELIQKQR